MIYYPCPMQRSAAVQLCIKKPQLMSSQLQWFQCKVLSLIVQSFGKKNISYFDYVFCLILSDGNLGGIVCSLSVIVQALIDNITIMASQSRNTKTPRSIFYRGISLKDYLRKSSVVHKNLEYPDDETILLDQNKTPVIIDDSFILTEPAHRHQQPRLRETHCATETRLHEQTSNIELPTLKSRSKFKIHTHNSYLTDRNSTDASYGSGLDLKTNILPDLCKKQSSCHEDNLFSSRSESKCVSRRKKPTEANKDLEQVEEEVVVHRGKPHLSREYTELIKKEMILKNRYNVGKPGISKARYYNRVKSFAE